MFDFFKNKKRKYKNTALVLITFDYNKFNEYENNDAFFIQVHPLLNDSEYINNTLTDLVRYIRDRYRTEDLSD